MKLHRLTLLMSVLLLVGPMVLAQGTSGTLTGTVMHDGAPLPGVTVSVTSPNLQGTRTTTTNDNGGYNIGALPPGEYVVTFELAGMQTQAVSAKVAVAQTSRADATLSLSALSESITVTATASPIIESTQVSSTFTAQQVDELRFRAQNQKF